MIQRKLEVVYQPFERTTRVPPGTTLFSAAHWIGLPIDSTCGGRGTCGKCKVRVIKGVTGLNEAAMNAVKRWTFIPAVDAAGNPIEAWTKVPVDFHF